MRGRCLIVDEMHDSIFTMLTDIGWAYDYEPSATRDAIKKLLPDYEGLIVRSKTTIDEALLASSHRLKFIARAGAGIDNIDVDYAESRSIHVIHAAEGNRDAVGEFTVGLLLALLRNIPRADLQVRDFVWEREKNRGEEIMGKTVSIIGYGNMGQSFAKRLSGFGCKVFAYDKYKSGFSDNFCNESQMERIFDETDILSLHIPLTDETRFMVDGTFINRFQRKLILLNTARGEIVRLSDLAEAIESGKIRGAALDVLENEKLKTLSPPQLQSFNYLKTRSNVIFSPHIAGWTFESHVKINVALVNKIRALNF